MRQRAARRVVIVGGGFGGLYAARLIAASGYPLTVVDRRNFHLFQPLLYQVATGGLSPGDIASPIRSVLRRHANARVLQDEAIGIDASANMVQLASGASLRYEVLVIATGSETSYFGNEGWREETIGLKSVEDALRVRRRVLGAFERAEAAPDEHERARLLTFAIVGGGPTGVELAGAIAELARSTLKQDFRSFDPADARILLLEGGDRLLPAFPPALSAKAERRLREMRIEVHTGTLVRGIEAGVITVDRSGRREDLAAADTILWAAGVTSTPFTEVVAARFGVEREGGRIRVHPDLSLPGHAHVFAVGDIVFLPGPDGRPLAGVAPVAMQQGRFVARRITGREAATSSFRYHDKGQLAVIGRNAAVCDLGRARLSGFPAWLLWVFVHIAYLIGFENRVLVLLQWAMSYVTRKRGARLITHRPAE